MHFGSLSQLFLAQLVTVKLVVSIIDLIYDITLYNPTIIYFYIHFQKSAYVVQHIPGLLKLPPVHLSARLPLQTEVIGASKQRNGYHH